MAKAMKIKAASRRTVVTGGARPWEKNRKEVDKVVTVVTAQTFACLDEQNNACK
jgi:hypothetical protein